MKLLFIDDLNANQLTKKELHNIVAKGDTRIDGGPDTDGEENCFPPPVIWQDMLVSSAFKLQSRWILR